MEFNVIVSCVQVAVARTHVDRPFIHSACVVGIFFFLIGDSFRSMIDDQYWQGTIVDRTPFDEAEPDSLWQCFSVRYVLMLLPSSALWCKLFCCRKDSGRTCSFRV